MEKQEKPVADILAETARLKGLADKREAIDMLNSDPQIYKVEYRTVSNMRGDILCHGFDVVKNSKDLTCCALVFMGEVQDLITESDANGNPMIIPTRKILGELFGVEEYTFELVED